MGWLLLVLLALSVGVLVAAEWPRLEGRWGLQGRSARARARRKAQFRVIESDAPDDTDDFAASVERDLSRLPTIDERDRR